MYWPEDFSRSILNGTYPKKIEYHFFSLVRFMFNFDQKLWTWVTKFVIAQTTLWVTLLSQIRGLVVLLRDRIHWERGHTIYFRNQG